MSVSYDSATALVVVDVQNDFADERGSLSVAGAARVIAATNAQVDDAVAGGAHVVYTQDWHPPDTPHFQKDGGVWPVHCVRETWGAQLHPDLTVAGDAVRKGTGGEDGYSGFTMRDPLTDETASTGLDELLRRRGVEHVVVVGLALDYCVKATALDGAHLGYDTTVIRAATAPVELNEGDGAAAEAELTAAGVHVTD